MARLACVDVPELPLQLLLRAHSDWAGLPAVVVDEDRPQGLVLWANDAARAFRILPGLRYATAHALCADVRAGTVAPHELDAALGELHTTLLRFSPEVEVYAPEPGVFWLDASGLRHVFASLEAWASALRQALAGELGLAASAVVGFTRFGTYALAKSRGRSPGGASGASPRELVFHDPHAEQRAAYQVRLDALAVPPALRDGLAKLGVHTLRDFVRLPASGLAERYGEEAARLHRLAAGHGWDRIFATAAAEPVTAQLFFDHRETNTERLTFAIKAQLHGLLARLSERGQALTALRFTLRLDDRTQVAEEVRPASPTLDVEQLVELVRLRLSAVTLRTPIVEVLLIAEGTEATREQLRLFAEHPRRDLDAAARALARLRAELGVSAVSRVALRDAHLPEAQYTLAPTSHLSPPRPLAVASRPLVRRVHARAVPLPARSRHERDDGWLVKGPGAGPAVRITGPYVLSGGWWQREVQRDYHFVELQNGELLWLYYDRSRRRWYLQGEVQ